MQLKKTHTYLPAALEEAEQLGARPFHDFQDKSNQKGKVKLKTGCLDMLKMGAWLQGRGLKSSV